MRGAWGPGADHCPLLPAPPPQIAKRQAVVNPENTFASVKRFIGRKMNEVGDESTQVPYRVVEDAAGALADGKQGSGARAPLPPLGLSHTLPHVKQRTGMIMATGWGGGLLCCGEGEQRQGPRKKGKSDG